MTDHEEKIYFSFASLMWYMVDLNTSFFYDLINGNVVGRASVSYGCALGPRRPLNGPTRQHYHPHRDKNKKSPFSPSSRIAMVPTSILKPTLRAVTSDPVWNLAYSSPCACYEILWGFSPTLVVEGGLDQHIRLLQSIPPSLG
jgi:hypothetical protein